MDKSNELVSVIIVASGISRYLFDCLVSVHAQSHSHLQVIVIDNSLNSFLSGKIKRAAPSAHLHICQVSTSYCDSLNIGIEKSSAEYILCLNDDVILENNFLEEALKGFLSGVGMVSGKILRMDKKTIDTTGLFLSCFRTPRERGYSQKDRRKFQDPGFCFGVNGAVALYKKEMLDKIKEENYFDSSFGFFYEDLDIAWRAQRKGWKGFYAPLAVAYHARGATLRKEAVSGKIFARASISDSLLADLIKNRYLAIIKNESLLGFLWHLPEILIYDCAAWSYCLLFRPGAAVIFLSRLKIIQYALKKRLAKK
ncbi:MAG: glycosyltransferase [Candidatus Omnitrophica bacterium]|jgi:GT2 family glycosyltransferase|nr:glycosyltransferase [Candidatus Omnitrophota bacterium]